MLKETNNLDSDTNTMRFKIKKGKHRASGLHFGITFKKKVRYVVSFDESCLYKFDDVDKHDINKLCGFATTWFHHRQSGRIGWRCVDGENIEILTYSYFGGNRSLSDSDILGVVKPNEKFVVMIEDNENHYRYSFKKLKGDGEFKTNTDRKNPDWFIFHYLLYPYFGGNKKAPHDMVINLSKVDLF